LEGSAQGHKVASKYEPLPFARHAVTYRTILLQPFLVRVEQLPVFSGGQIVSLSAIDSLAISGLTRKVAQAAKPFLNSAASQKTLP
jgi:hypothetical protein